MKKPPTCTYHVSFYIHKASLCKHYPGLEELQLPIQLFHLFLYFSSVPREIIVFAIVLKWLACFLSLQRNKDVENFPTEARVGSKHMHHSPEMRKEENLKNIQDVRKSFLRSRILVKFLIISWILA